MKPIDLSRRDFGQWYAGTYVKVKGDEVVAISEYLEDEFLETRMSFMATIQANRPKPGLYPYEDTVVRVSWPAQRQYKRGACPENCAAEYFLKYDRMWNGRPHYPQAIAVAFCFDEYPETIKRTLQKFDRHEAPRRAFPIDRYLCLERITPRTFNIRDRLDVIGEVTLDSDDALTATPAITIFSANYEYLAHASI